MKGSEETKKKKKKKRESERNLFYCSPKEKEITSVQFINQVS
jgi:hypothetical protein